MKGKKAFMCVYKSYRQRDAVWFDSDWPGRPGMQRGHGVRLDECFVILRGGLYERGSVVWFELVTS